ncbi:MAG TPA: GNAT family N-acetyltransferase [Thermoleophilaceae bacterium]|nr:GNAT family N-acetyltransferase [Thermoleophilaceae bacterium]
MSASPSVRPFAVGDEQATVPLLYESSGGMYDRLAGNRALAERTLTRALGREQTTASADVVWVAEVDGRIAGAMAAMPYTEWTPRAHRFLRTTLRTVPPWRWPRALWLYRSSGRMAPEPSGTSLYIDSLATATGHRRQGVATAMLAEAEAMARRDGLRALALDTWQDNHPARALYLREGFEEVAYTPASGSLPGGVSLVKELAFR